MSRRGGGSGSRESPFIVDLQPVRGARSSFCNEAFEVAAGNLPQPRGFRGRWSASVGHDNGHGTCRRSPHPEMRAVGRRFSPDWKSPWEAHAGKGAGPPWPTVSAKARSDVSFAGRAYAGGLAPRVAACAGGSLAGKDSAEVSSIGSSKVEESEVSEGSGHRVRRSIAAATPAATIPTRRLQR